MKKKWRKLLLLFLAAVLAFCLCACGETGSGSGGASGTEDGNGSEFQVIIYSKTSAEFILNDIRMEPDEERRIEIFFSTNTGSYRIEADSSDRESRLCRMPENVLVDGCAAYEYDGERLSISLNMGNGGISYNLYDVQEYTIEFSNFEGKAPVTYAAADVVTDKGTELADGGSQTGGQGYSPAEDFEFEDDGNGGLRVVRYLGKDSEVSVPGTVDGKQVTEIGKSAFSSAAGLTSVVLPEGVTKLESHAFADCKSMTSAYIPGSVKEIGDHAFYFCESLADVTFGNGIETVAEYAFEGCNSLRDMTLPDSVTWIDDFGLGSAGEDFDRYAAYRGRTYSVRALYQNNYGGINEWLEDDLAYFEYKIADGEAVITKFTGQFADVVIPAAIEGVPVTKIGDGTEYPESLVFPRAGEYIRSVTLPDSVTTIDSFAFSGCVELKSIRLEKITSIGNGAFSGCRSLTSVTIPEAITHLSDSAFMDCSSLTSVSLPESLREIGLQAFGGCGFNGITIPDGVTKMDFAFERCDNLKSIVLPGSVESFERAFENSGVVSVTLKPGITAVSVQAFFGCENLAEVILPDSVTEIGIQAFRECRSLARIDFPDKLKSIETRAFDSCESLTELVIPNSVTSIGGGAFAYCKSLASVTLPDRITEIPNGAFAGCTSLTGITIPGSVTSINDEAFCACESLTDVVIPDSVKKLGFRAFACCTNLTSVSMPSGTRFMKGPADGTFISCPNLTVTFR